MDAKLTHLYAFEAEVHRLIEQAGVTLIDFFNRNPGMRDAKWTIAHFSYGQGQSAEQGAADWFAECVKPAIDRMRKPAIDPAMSYADKVTAVKDKYADRIVAVLNRIRDVLVEAGYNVDEPADISCDDYRWSMVVWVNGEPGAATDGDIDITLQIAESEQFDGTEDGINFALDIVEYGGRILGGLTPYNYTSDVWVRLDDEDAIEARFSIFEEADPADILPALPQMRKVLGL